MPPVYRFAVSSNHVAIEFGHRLRAARLKAGLSQESLADLAGLHRTYVSGAERGLRNISLVNIVRLASALDIAPGELLDGLTGP